MMQPLRLNRSVAGAMAKAEGKVVAVDWWGAVPQTSREPSVACHQLYHTRRVCRECRGACAAACIHCRGQYQQLALQAAQGGN